MAAFRLKGFGEERASRAIGLLKDDRRLALRDKYIDIQANLFRDCVTVEADLRAVLSAEHYTAAEADQLVKNKLAERQIRTFLPVTDVGKAVSEGLMSLPDAVNGLQCRGYTYDDAMAEIILHFKQMLPPCDDAKLKQKELIAMLQAFGHLIGLNGHLLNGYILKYLQCLDLTAFLLPPVGHINSTVHHMVGPGNVTLQWTTELATHARITPTIGPVPTEGETTVHITHSTGFTLTAINPIGETQSYVFIDVTPTT